MRYYNYFAEIAGEYKGISPLLVKNPLTHKLGWRLCTFFDAFTVIGFRLDPNLPRRAKVAIPLGEILNLPVTEKDQEKIFLNRIR